MPEVAQTTDTDTAEIERAGESLAAWVEAVEEPEALAALRREAWDEYRSLPMPTRKSEEWRYTDISGLEPGEYRPMRPGTPERLAAEALPGPVRQVLESDRRRSAVAVLRNGGLIHLDAGEALAEAGVLFAPIRRIASERPELLERYLFASDVAPPERKLWTLHVALLADGYVLHVPRDTVVPDPVHVFHWLEEGGLVAATHSLVIAEPGAEVTVVDEYLSPDLDERSLSLTGVEIFGADNASVRHLGLQRYGRGVWHFGMQHVNTGRDSRLMGLNVALGADLSRADVTSHLAGPGAESEMLALWFGDGAQHIDHNTVQHHDASHAHSDLLYKGALSGEARSVFRGLIRVEKGAQLTDAYQTNRNLLLSDDAHATALPNLEIEADDVRCSHGATVGQVDENQLFYLMSRGLDRHRAERLLVFGFFEEVLDRVPLEGVRERLRAAIETKIGI